MHTITLLWGNWVHFSYIQTLPFKTLYSINEPKDKFFERKFGVDLGEFMLILHLRNRKCGCENCCYLCAKNN